MANRSDPATRLAVSAPADQRVFVGHASGLSWDRAWPLVGWAPACRGAGRPYPGGAVGGRARTERSRCHSLKDHSPWS